MLKMVSSSIMFEFDWKFEILKVMRLDIEIL